LEFKHSLDIAKMQIQHQSEMLLLAGKIISEKDKQIKFFQDKDGKYLSVISDTIQNFRDDAREWREIIVKYLDSSSDNLRDSLLFIYQTVENQRIDDEKKFVDAVNVVKNEKPDFLEALSGRVRSAAAEGLIGNAFYDWFVGVIGTLPR